MKGLCKDCIEYFHFSLPQNSYSVYDAGLCDGCLHETQTTNPKFYLLLVEKDAEKAIKNGASPVESKQEKCGN